jgi:hypothetical protein
MSRPASRLRAVALDAATGLLGTGIVMSLLLAGGGIWDRQTFPDLHGLFLSKYEYIARSIVREGRLPLWNPFEFCGMPLLASPQFSALYPPVPILFAFLPPRPALQSYYAFHVFLLTWSSVAYLRRNSVGRRYALLVPFVVLDQTFRGIANLAVDHPNFLAGVAWVPLMLLALQNAIEHDGRWIAALALVAALQWISGYPDVVLCTNVLLVVVALASGGGSLTRRLRCVVAGLGLGALLAAPQLVPLAEAVRESARTLAPAGAHAVMRLQMASFFLRSFVVPSGVAGLLLVAFALRHASRPALTWVCAVVWCLFGLYPPLSLLYALPGFSGVRVFVGWSNVGPLFVAFLMAAGLGAAFARGQTRVVRGAALAAAAVLVWHSALAIVHLPGALRLPAPDYPELEARAAILGPILRASVPPARFISTADLTGGSTLRFALPSPAGFEPSMPPRRPLLLGERLHFAWSARFGAPTWAALAQSPDLGALLGLGAVVTPATAASGLEGAGFTRRASLPGGDVVWVRPPVPRVRLVHRVRRVAGEAAALDAVASLGADAWTTAVVEEDTPPLDTAATSAADGVRVIADRAEELLVAVDAAGAGLLVVTDTFFPGWHARLDGAPVPIVRADFAFRAVHVPAGRHRVELRYSPASFHLGLAVAGASLVVLLLIALRSYGFGKPTT